MPSKNPLLFMPVAMNITNKKILIIGGGKVAAHKLVSLLQYTRDVTILAPEIQKELFHYAGLKFRIKLFEKSDLQHFDIVYACTDNRHTNALIKRYANAMHIMVNVADDPELCDFVSPAIYKQDHISVAVSSNSQDVKRAIEIRDSIKDLLSK